MDFDVAHRTILARLQVFHDTAFTNCRAERGKRRFHCRSAVSGGVNDVQVICFYSHVCKHSVIVVASMK